MFIFESELPPLIKNTKTVLQHLRDNDLYLKPSKCEFHKTKIEYLGLVIEEGKIYMDTTKLKGIWDWPIPTTVKQVRGFLGFGNFYRCFIRGFSDLAQPMNDYWRRTGNLNGLSNVRSPSKHWNNNLPKNQSWQCQTIHDHFRLNQMPPNTRQERSSHNSTRTEIGTRWPFFWKPFHRLNETTKSMTENYLRWFAHLKSGDTISKDQDTLQMFSLIIKIWRYRRSMEIEQTTSMMVPFPIRIRHQADSYTWKKYDRIRCSFTKTWSLCRRWHW